MNCPVQCAELFASCGLLGWPTISRPKLHRLSVSLDWRIGGNGFLGTVVSATSRVVSAKIQCDAVQPGYELRGRLEFSDIEVGPDKDLFGQFQGIGFVGYMPEYETEQPFPVPFHQGVESQIIAGMKRLH